MNSQKNIVKTIGNGVLEYTRSPVEGCEIGYPKVPPSHNLSRFIEHETMNQYELWKGDWYLIKKMGLNNVR